MLTCYATVALATPSYRYTIPHRETFVKEFFGFYAKSFRMEKYISLVSFPFGRMITQSAMALTR